MQTKYIFITGGVVSGLGKGIAAASIGALLETRGLSISLMKLDPYINVDAGTMNPFQHGEVFVTEDGGKPTWTWGITSVFPVRFSVGNTIPPLVRFTMRSSARNEKENTSVLRFRWCRM